MRTPPAAAVPTIPVVSQPPLQWHVLSTSARQTQQEEQDKLKDRLDRIELMVGAASKQGSQFGADNKNSEVPESVTTISPYFVAPPAAMESEGSEARHASANLDHEAAKVSEQLLAAEKMQMEEKSHEFAKQVERKSQQLAEADKECAGMRSRVVEAEQEMARLREELQASQHCYKASEEARRTARSKSEEEEARLREELQALQRCHEASEESRRILEEALQQREQEFQQHRERHTDAQELAGTRKQVVELQTRLHKEQQQMEMLCREFHATAAVRTPADFLKMAKACEKENLAHQHAQLKLENARLKSDCVRFREALVERENH
jgi:hypothetical protein